MRKLISLLLALAMVFSLAIVASAEEASNQSTPPNYDQGTSFTKEYTVSGGTAPAEDFAFAVEYQSYKDNEGNDGTATTHPTVTLGKASFTNKMPASTAAYTATASVTITNYENAALGVYTYKITETAGSTAGVGYVADPVYLVVTVLRDEESNKHFVAAVHYETATGDKIGKTTNTYDAGTLTISKEITGNMADMLKKFQFTVTLTPAEGTTFADIQNALAGVTPTKNENGTWTYIFSLGDGEKAEFTNIPVGSSYTVSEETEGYTQKIEGAASGSISAENKAATVTYTNTLENQVDTGITLDSIPFVLILAVCAGAAVLFLIKRRSVEF